MGVTVDGRPVRLGRNRQLTVLALLLINVNKPVPVSRLVDAVWGGTPPATADKQVQTCVWRLRTTFQKAGAPEDLIETVQGGYLLRLPEGHLDAQLFEERVRTGRAHAEAGDLASAVSTYRSALTLFQGPPLAELTGTALQAVAANWEERRLSVLEERLDIELAMGMHVELVSELRLLVAEHPLREQLRAQLMAALYLSHRRADALAVYRAGRAALVNNLGLEPGARLQELHRRIIAGDPLPTAQHARPRAAPRAPAQLPADVGDFTGRDPELRWLVSELRRDTNGPRVLALVGRGGVGKTALAVHAAHQVRDSFPDGQLHADLRGSAEPVPQHEILRHFLHALGVPEHRMAEDVAGRAAQFRSTVAGKRLIILLDDAPDASWIEPFLPGGSCVVLVTAQASMIELPGLVSRRVGDLEPVDAVRLLAAVADPGRVAREPQSAHTIVELCGHLPLAVRAAGARLRARPQCRLERFADRLVDERQRIAELSYGSLDLGMRLAAAAARLTPAERTLWLALSLPDLVRIPTWAAAAAAQVSDHQAQCLLDGLVDHQVLDPAGEDVRGSALYVFHPLVRIHARQLARTELTPGERAGAVDRLEQVWQVFETHARGALGHRPYPPAPVPGIVERIGYSALREVVDNASAWLDQERPNLVALLRDVGWAADGPERVEYGVHSA